ncbi:MAG: hypothetical protein QOE55_7890 [Acidobacteriaceae bacterium]|nr:hypothetical protein [Acidobacteriaceae bacterium]
MDLLSELTSQKPPAEIYHYTDAAGLIGIVHGKAIWATSHLHLNDASEHQIAGNLINEELKKAKLSDQQRRVFGLILKSFQEPYYIASFSERGNLLSQWRAYAGLGLGYSIGFAPTNPLFHAAGSEAFNLVKCQYKLKDQRRFARYLVLTFEEQYWATGADKGTESGEILRGFFRRYGWHYALALFVSTCKHSSFAAEREWRLVSQYPDRLAQLNKIRYRTGRFGIVPYFPIPLTPHPDGKPRFDSITIGPAANEDASRKALESLVKTRLDDAESPGKTKPQIISSKIPYRP